MPKSRGPGGKNRKKAKGPSLDTRRELVFREDGSVYAYVSEALGDGHYKLVCSDGTERMGVLRGKMWRRVWVRRNDIVLATLRDYQDNKADIVHKYMSDEVNRLISLGELPSNVSKHYTAGEYDPNLEETEEDTIIFDEDGYVDNI
ncbi:translation initiation factor 1A [Tetraselmis virus 1]|uniref:Translation initiation factor 1A n=1 Tax=Tetraselmis virus 1 TaxID=2060617 RepID=A0A2P0VMN2_9VIRU|nr:translation initiation factor 1A [Tetraselmis virus 1]AUF82151.1 translation initiation factor 1A [Tetraselmis virus 1]